MKGLFQNNYHILMADSTVKIFTDLKVGDKLKSWDVSKREFIALIQAFSLSDFASPLR